MQRLRPLVLRSSKRLTVSSSSVSTSTSIINRTSASAIWSHPSSVQSVQFGISSFSTSADAKTKSKPKSKAVTSKTKLEANSKPLAWTLNSVTHSRYHLPPVAPFDLVQSLTTEILSAPIGSLFAFDESDVKTFEHPHDVSEKVTQKIEYILRGHSALICQSALDLDLLSDGKNKNLHTKLRKDIPDKETEKDKYQSWEDARASMAAQERLSFMEQLVDRLQKEGEFYQQQAEEHRKAQLLPTETNTVAEDSDNDEENTEGQQKDTTKTKPCVTRSFAPKQKPATVAKTIQEQYSTPGPTIHMYDLILDAYAISALDVSHNPNTTLEMLKKADAIYQAIMKRHEIDGRHNNTNSKTIPTTITFNALIRTAANVPYLSDPSHHTVSHLSKLDVPTQKVRDTALNIGLRTFEQMHSSDCVERNAATYKYVLQIIHKFIPECRSRGNIVRSYFDLACKEGVVDQNVTEALKNNGGGEPYTEWVEDILGKESKEFPRGWKRTLKKRQSNLGSAGLY